MEAGNVGPTGGGSDDIGDISWVVPTVMLSYPSNIPGGPGHNWANGVSMATPIAHKGVVAGAKVQAMTMLDHSAASGTGAEGMGLFQQRPDERREVQELHPRGDKPAIWLNEKTMEQYRPRMKSFYYDPAKYDTYLEQLGIKYPTVKAAQ